MSLTVLTHTHTRARTYTLTHARRHTHSHTDRHTYTDTRTHTQTDTDTHAHRQADRQAHTQTHTHTLARTHIKSLNIAQKLSSCNLLTCKTFTTSCGNIETARMLQDRATISITAIFTSTRKRNHRITRLPRDLVILRTR